MTRSFALLIAVLLTWVSVTSVGLAAQLGQLDFQLIGNPNGSFRLALTDEGQKIVTSSSDYQSAELRGLDLSALAASRAPINFALVRDAGRLDCAGTSEGGAARGTCRFTADSSFADLLAGKGIGRPSERESFGLLMVTATRSLVDAVAAAGYSAPGIDDLTALAALGVTPDYIREMSASDVRPKRISDLIAFKALGVTAGYARDLRRAGLRDMEADDLVQLKALEVSPDYIASLRAVGFDGLSTSEIVQLKALNVTADYIGGFRRAGVTMTVDKLIQARAMGVRPEELRPFRAGQQVSIEADELIRLKITGLLP